MAQMNAEIIEFELCNKHVFGMTALVEHPCRDDKLAKYNNFMGSKKYGNDHLIF